MPLDRDEKRTLAYLPRIVGDVRREPIDRTVFRTQLGGKIIYFDTHGFDLTPGEENRLNPDYT
jgi:hypothetical protein